jgi:hypothetical protein
MRFVDRYLATDNPANHPRYRLHTVPRGDNAILEAMNEHELERQREWSRVEASGAADFFAPDQWAVADADVIEADERGERAPARLLRFLAAHHDATDQYLHYCDRELALAYLQRARARSLADIARLPTAAAQLRAVTAIWKDLCTYFHALNIRPWGWARYRNTLEREFGAFLPRRWTTHNEYGILVGTPVPGPIAPSGAPAGYTFLLQRRPTELAIDPESVSLPVDLDVPIRPPDLSRTIDWRAFPPGRWRRMAFDRYRALYSAPHAGLNARFVRFGSPALVNALRDREESCFFTGSPGRHGPEGCLPGDAHALWMSVDATLEGSQPYESNPVTAGQLRWHDCAPRSLSTGEATGNDLAPFSAAGFSWTCGAITEETPLIGPDGIFYLPPMIWYAQLLQPLLAYLSTRDPLEIVHEVRLDIWGRNLWTLLATGRRDDVLATLAQQTALRTVPAFTQTLRNVSAGAGMVAGVASLLNPVAGAIVGLLSSTVNLVGDLADIPRAYPIDCFGRLEPSLDYFSLVEASARFQRGDALGVMPGAPDGFDPSQEAPVVLHQTPVAVLDVRPVQPHGVPNTNPQEGKAADGSGLGPIAAAAAVSAAAVGAVLYRRKIAAALRRPFRRSRR